MIASDVTRTGIATVTVTALLLALLLLLLLPVVWSLFLTSRPPPDCRQLALFFTASGSTLPKAPERKWHPS